jgi:hypothetical protein
MRDMSNIALACIVGVLLLACGGSIAPDDTAANSLDVCAELDENDCSTNSKCISRFAQLDCGSGVPEFFACESAHRVCHTEVVMASHPEHDGCWAFPSDCLEDGWIAGCEC